MKLKQGKNITLQDSGDNLARYFAEIRNFGPLSKEQEWALIARIQQSRDGAALDKLIKHNARFVIGVAKHYQGMGVAVLDLISLGNEGMIEAAYRFDLNKKIKFFSYAVWWIRNKMYLNINLGKRTVQLPQNRWILCDDVKREISELECLLQRIPTIEELTDSINEKEQLKAKREKKKKPNVYSTYDIMEAINGNAYAPHLQDKLKSDDEEFCLETFLPGNLSIDDDDTKNSFKSDLDKFLAQLCQFEYDVLILVLGLNGEPVMKPKEIGVLLGMKEKDVVKLKNRAFERLKGIKNINFLKQYI